MPTRHLFPCLFLLLCGLASTGAHAQSGGVLLIPFDDDEKSESMALLNDEFSAAYPAGPLVTTALREALARRGFSVADVPPARVELSGTVTAAYMMSRGLPTNTVTARYRLVSLPDRRVLAAGDASGKDWNNPDAANKLATDIVTRAFK